MISLNWLKTMVRSHFLYTHREYKVLAHSLAQKAMVENLYETSPKISYLE